MDNVIMRSASSGSRGERRETLHITLVIIGSGLLRRNTEGGVRSEELGVVGGGERTEARGLRTEIGADTFDRMTG